jgi:hypothetical protein
MVVLFFAWRLRLFNHRTFFIGIVQGTEIGVQSMMVVKFGIVFRGFAGKIF